MAKTITTYRITFERIGRKRNVASIAIAADETEPAQVIARKVFGIARQHLISSDVNVEVELGTEPASGGRGWITAGFQTVGTFTVTPTLTTEE